MGELPSRIARDQRASPVGHLLRTQLRLATFALLSLTLATEQGIADRCATQAEMNTLKVAAFQQQLMVAALTCHRIGSYNRFVRAYRSSLVNSDRSMLRLFVRLDGTDGDADYNAYKTRLANLAMLRNDASGGAYCREAGEDFAAAASNRGALADFVATRHLDVRIPFEACESAAPTTVAERDVSEAPRPHRHHRHTHRVARPV